MGDMGEVPMPGGWTLSTAWMPMCGQSWAGAAASFVGMWVLMMVPMMAPSLVPALWRHRLGARAALVGTGYFFVWTVFGFAVFVVGAALAQGAMAMPSVARAAPVALATVVLLAGAFQFTACKAHHLACCRQAAGPRPALVAGAAWQHGVRLGLHCCRACAGPTAILLVFGVMDPRAMAVVTAAITAERLAPAGERVAWAVGAVAIAAGLYLMGRAAWPV